MTEKELKISYSEVCTFLAERKLKPALDLLNHVISLNHLEVFRDEWRTLEQTYSFMLQYTVEGTQDPERQKIYRKLIVSVFELADSIFANALLKVSSGIDYEKKRIFHFYQIDDLQHYFAELEDYFLHSELVSLVKEAEINTDSSFDENSLHKKMERLFYHFWLTDKYNNKEIQFLTWFFASEMISEHYKSFIVSAINLGLIRFFDEQKFSVLFDIYEQQEPEIGQRSFVSLLIAMYKYDRRLSFYPAITGRLSILNDDPSFKRNLEQVIIQLIRSRETEKIQQKIRDEIIPEMIKISPTLKDKINLEGLMGEGSDDDKNPEWQEIFKDSPGLMNKMEEFSELQMEGADVFMGSFAMLKMYPFFSEFTNWFIPFFASNPQIKNVADSPDDITRRFVEIIDGAPILCNSDKYSFCFSISQLPVESREFMAQGMSAEISQLLEIQKDEEFTDPGKLKSIVSNQYIQDLYRFFKIHPRKSNFDDMFSWKFDFHNSNVIGTILKEDEKVLRNIAEYYFKKNYFDEAADIFQFLLGKEENGELYQKIGYCYQKSGNYERALETYLKSELFDQNKLWSFQKIALCYRNLKQPKKALEYYLEIEKLDPENLNTELNIGHCYLELGQFEEALKYYFKVEYLAPGNKKVWRPLGWCSFVTGKKNQAARYFQLLIDDEPGKHDLMNMGHVQWSLGNRKLALEFYKKSISQTLFSEKEFFEIFDEDQQYLINQGVDEDDVPIMLDQLRYFVEE